MSNRVRYVYIPIEKISQAADFTVKELDGLDRAEAWALFQTKEEEIEEWGDRLLERFATKKGQFKMVDVKPEPDDTGRTGPIRRGPGRAASSPYKRPEQEKQILGSTKVLRHGDGDKPLQVITQGKNAVIYVHCHGNSEVVGLRPKKLDPAQLAKRLAEDGLPKPNTPVIKLWSCHSGERYGSAERRFVDLFAQALGEVQKYDGVEVYGYEGALYVTEVGEAKTAKSNDVVYRASDKRTEKVISRAKK